ncbi:SLAF1 protein, partial [Donacobius atricapilla]|nr:SLAF1 protein [Donacobius atricapilla]
LEGPRRKKTLGRLSGGNVTELEPGRARFHRRDLSLEILNASREDARLYEFSASRGHEERVWEVQLDVLEPVSRPRIRVLRREVSNGSCSLALGCASERGDHVSYTWHAWHAWHTWHGGDGGDGGLCSGSGELLNLSFALPGAGLRCACTASNAVGNRSAAFDAARCGLPEP